MLYVPTYHAPRKGKKIAPAQNLTAYRQKIVRRVGLFTLLAYGLSGGAPALGAMQGERISRREGPVSRIPFVRAAHRVSEPAFDTTFTPGASAANLGPFEIPARGFLRSILLLVEGTGGTLGAGVLSEDYPFVLFDSIELTDTSGRNIYGPVSGYDTFIINLLGGYQWASDPRDAPGYVGTINASFAMRIPVEITAWDAYGSLANQAQNANYRVRLVGAASGTAFTTAPTTAPAVRVRGYVEAWSQPEPADLQNNPQEQLPPGHGTTQFWSLLTASPNSGANTVQLRRVGNLIRNILIINRNRAAPAARTADFPDNFSLRWDSSDIITQEPRRVRRQIMEEVFGRLENAYPTGIFAYPFTDDQDGHAGNENRHLYLPTVQATRLEAVGTWDANSDIRILTNDVAPVGGR